MLWSKIPVTGLGVWLGEESILFIRKGSDLLLKAIFVNLKNLECGFSEA